MEIWSPRGDQILIPAVASRLELCRNPLVLERVDWLYMYMQLDRGAVRIAGWRPTICSRNRANALSRFHSPGSGAYPAWQPHSNRLETPSSSTSSNALEHGL